MRKPPKSKRPKVKSVRTTKVGDPDVNKIYFEYSVDESLSPDKFKDEVLSNIKNIRLTTMNNSSSNSNQYDIEALTLSNITYETVENPSSTDTDPEFYCNIQPTPHHAVNAFFNIFSNNSPDDEDIIDISITYEVLNENGSHGEVVDIFPNKPYSYPTEHQ